MEIAPQLPKQDHADIKQAVLNMECLPSMRLLSMAGEAVHRNNLCAYNCSYLPINCIDAFAECLLILMNGTGVGFSVETEYVDKLPRIVRQKDAPALSYKIEDSTDGWVDALRTGMQIWFNGGDVTFDYSSIRPEGSPLRTKGGYSSGQGPLQSLLEFLRDRLLANQSRRLEPIDCHDIVCRIGETVCVGNVRRAALISLSDLDDVAIRGAKDGQFWLKHPYRTQSNNSAVYNSKPPAVEFLTEWLSLAKSGSGERGIFNRGGVIDSLPTRRQNTGDYGINPCGEINLRPCQLCVHGDTLLVTKYGICTIKQVVDEIVEVWNGSEWTPVIPRLTGTNQPMVRVQLSDGSYLDCTPEHEFSIKHRFKKTWDKVAAKDLLNYSKWGTQLEYVPMVNSGVEPHPEAYDLGFAVGDGFVESGRVTTNLYGAKQHLPLTGRKGKPYLAKGYNQPHIPLYGMNVDKGQMSALKWNHHAIDELFKWDTNSILQFMAGLADADGSNTMSGTIRIYISREWRARKFQLLLNKVGVRSSVNLMARKGTITNKGERHQDIWYLQVTECQQIPCQRLDTSKGHAPKCHAKYQNVTRVDNLDGLHDSYCFVEPKTHKAVFNNSLTYQCNLTEVVARTEDDEFHLLRKVRLATIMGTIQATLTHFPGLRPEWKQNCEEERLLGVSLTGIMDCSAVRSVYLLEKLRAHAIEVNKKYAALLKINQSAAITCVKPSGTVSQLVNSSSGIHCRWSQYYIRRIRISALDPLFAMMKALGVPHFPEVGQSSHNASIWVLEFPVKSPDGATTRHDLTALDQLENWLVFKGCYTEHSPSSTIYVGADEWVAVGAWVYENWDQISGLSFLPKTDYVYSLAPYEEITRREYEKRVAEFPDIDYNLLSKYEQFDQTASEMEMACVGGACEIH